ncbi:MAG: transposase [Lewinellaceae bacterium]|nr:transposase [Lewinellaceae bacterium]
MSILLNEVSQKTFHMSPGSPQELKAYLIRYYPEGNITVPTNPVLWVLDTRRINSFRYQDIGLSSQRYTDNREGETPKTDKRDSLKIAKALRKGDCEGIFVPDKAQQKARSLVRQRGSLVRDRQRIMHRIKSHLSYYGVVCEVLTWRQDWSKNIFNG